MRNKQKNKGFTLIELLVVISIVGLLSSMIFAATNSARIKARDTRRIQDLDSLQKAIELYMADKGTAPLQGVYTTDYAINNWSQLGSKLSAYMAKIPDFVDNPDPNFEDNYWYVGGKNISASYFVSNTCIRIGSGGGYLLLVNLERSDAGTSDGGASNGYYERVGGDYSIVNGVCNGSYFGISDY